MKITAALIGLFFAGDALAWGLSTHVFFAQHALLALPFADSDFRRAAARLPRLVLAGACLPDLAFIGNVVGMVAFRRSHQWATLRRFGAARCDEERAVALGYASHLMADVIAHNRFVPEHEQRIARIPHATHAVCEWAMDHYLRGRVAARPADLLMEERRTLVHCAARGFRCGERLAERAIGMLAGAERALRLSPLPRLSRAMVRRFDADLASRFDGYLNDTRALLAGMDTILDSADPPWEPEPTAYAIANEAPAIAAPTRAPAITSLG